MKSFAARLVITASAATFLISGPAAAAARAPAAAYSPWASLSAFAFGRMPYASVPTTPCLLGDAAHRLLRLHPAGGGQPSTSSRARTSYNTDSASCQSRIALRIAVSYKDVLTTC